nr:cuticle protein AM1199-like [Penaeus vannamei]
MKAAVVLLFCVGVGVFARPQEVVEEVQEEETPVEVEEEEAPSAAHVPILVDIREPISNGAYSFRIEQGDGISRSESAAATGPLGEMETVGEYTFTHPDGTLHHLRYTAGVGGFLPESDMLPTPTPSSHGTSSRLRSPKSRSDCRRNPNPRTKKKRAAARRTKLRRDESGHLETI